MVKLFSNNLNLCDHDTSTSRDGQTTYRSNAALCEASRGKNEIRVSPSEEMNGRNSVALYACAKAKTQQTEESDKNSSTNVCGNLRARTQLIEIIRFISIKIFALIDCVFSQ